MIIVYYRPLLPLRVQGCAWQVLIKKYDDDDDDDDDDDLIGRWTKIVGIALLSETLLCVVISTQFCPCVFWSVRRRILH